MKAIANRGATDLEHRLKTLSSNKAIVETFTNQTAHTDGPKMIEIQVPDKTSRSPIMYSRDWGDPGVSTRCGKKILLVETLTIHAISVASYQVLYGVTDGTQ